MQAGETVHAFNARIFGIQRVRYLEVDCHIGHNVLRLGPNAARITVAPGVMCGCLCCEVQDIVKPGERVNRNNGKLGSARLSTPSHYASEALWAKPGSQYDGLTGLLNKIESVKRCYVTPGTVATSLQASRDATSTRGMNAASGLAQGNANRAAGIQLQKDISLLQELRSADTTSTRQNALLAELLGNETHKAKRARVNRSQLHSAMGQENYAQPQRDGKLPSPFTSSLHLVAHLIYVFLCKS